jgi:hypothetical protein
VGLLEEPEPRVGKREVELVVLDVRGAVGVLNRVRVAHTGLAEVPGSDAIEEDVVALLGASAEAILHRRRRRLQPRLIAQIHLPAGLEEHVPLDDRPPTAEVARATDQRDNPVLVGHEGEPERLLEEPLLRVRRTQRVVHAVDPSLESDGVGIVVVVSVDEIGLVPIEPGVDGPLLRQRRDIDDHRREGSLLAGVGLEDGVVVVLPIETHLAVFFPDEAVVFVRGSGTQGSVIGSRAVIEAVVELHEVLRKEVERPELLPRPEREVRGIEVRRYRRPGSARKQARPSRRSQASRSGQLKEIRPIQ